MDWLAFIELEQEEDLWTVRKADIYMAQIAAEVRRGISKKPNAVKVSDFLLRKNPPRPRIKPTLEQSKKFWAAAVGLKKEK